MKTAKVLLTALLTAGVLFMAGCPAPKPDNPKLSADFASSELMNNKGSYDHYAEADATADIVFTTNYDAKKFRFIAVAYTEVDGKFMLTEEKVLYSYGTLNPKKPLVISTTFYGVIPNRGIAFVDFNNVERYYALSLSGKDGSVQLIAFEDFK